MGKSAIIAIGYEGVDTEKYYQEVNKVGHYVMIEASNPYLADMIAYGDRIAIFLKGADVSQVSGIAEILKERGFDVKLDILTCSYIESVVNNVNNALDTNVHNTSDVWTSFSIFMESLPELSLNGFSSVSIINENGERYNPEFDMGKVLEYLNLTNATNETPGIEDKIKAVIAKFTACTEAMPHNEFYKLYSQISTLMDFAEKKDLALE